MDELAAEQKARAIEDLVAIAPATAGMPDLHLGASAGFTLLRPDESAEEALARADRAMYARKEERRSRR